MAGVTSLSMYEPVRRRASLAVKPQSAENRRQWRQGYQRLVMKELMWICRQVTCPALRKGKCPGTKLITMIWGFRGEGWWINIKIFYFLICKISDIFWYAKYIFDTHIFSPTQREAPSYTVTNTLTPIPTWNPQLPQGPAGKQNPSTTGHVSVFHSGMRNPV